MGGKNQSQTKGMLIAEEGQIKLQKTKNQYKSKRLLWAQERGGMEVAPGKSPIVGAKRLCQEKRCISSLVTGTTCGKRITETNLPEEN